MNFPNRWWQAGKARIRGKLVTFKNELILIETPSGTLRRVDIKTLSRADLLWLVRILRDAPNRASEDNDNEQPFRKVQVEISTSNLPFGSPVRIPGMT